MARLNNNNRLGELWDLHQQMRQGDRVEAELTQTGATRIYATDRKVNCADRDAAKRFSKGYAAVYKVVAANVGNAKADKIMKKVLKDKAKRRDGWASYWSPRKSAITKGEFGRIITETYKEVNSQMERADNDKRHKLLARLTVNNGPLPLEQVLVDPELSRLLRAQAEKDQDVKSVKSLNLLQDCEKLDKLVQEAQGLQQKLNGQGVKTKYGKEKVWFESDGKPNSFAYNNLAEDDLELTEDQEKLLKEYREKLGKMHAEFTAFKKRVMLDDGNSCYNLSPRLEEQLRSELFGYIDEQPDFNQVRRFIGNKPPTPSQPGATKPMRDEAFDSLQAGLYPALIETLKNREVSTDEVNHNTLEKWSKSMTEDDHLRMDNGTLYIKADRDPKHGKPRTNRSRRRSFVQIFKWFAGAARVHKFRRARNTVQDALAKHFGTPGKPNGDAAKSVMNRVFQGDDNRAMKKADLQQVVNYTKKQDSIQSTLSTLKHDGKLHEVNTVSPETVMRELDSKDPGQKQEVTRMLQLYSEIRGGNIQRQVQVCCQIATLLENQDPYAKNCLWFIDGYRLDFTPEARRLRGAFLRGSSSGELQRKLASELRQMACNMVKQKLTEFRDDPKVAKYLGDNLFNAAANKIDDVGAIDVLRRSAMARTGIEPGDRDGIYAHRPIDMLKDANSSVKAAFQLCCQQNGISVFAASKELAEFIENLEEYSIFSYRKKRSTWMEEFRKPAQYIDENLEITDSALNKRRGVRSANDTLKRLSKGKSITEDDARHLSRTLRWGLHLQLEKLQNAVSQAKNDMISIEN
ncbi:MAG: hypothetical protein MI861_20980 [Pirellulales bacterium]|nr:hypothetical protein [Pirellulales bacterium]